MTPVAPSREVAQHTARTEAAASARGLGWVLVALLVVAVVALWAAGAWFWAAWTVLVVGAFVAVDRWLP